MDAIATSIAAQTMRSRVGTMVRPPRWRSVPSCGGVPDDTARLSPGHGLFPDGPQKRASGRVAIAPHADERAKTERMNEPLRLLRLVGEELVDGAVCARVDVRRQPIVVEDDVAPREHPGIDELEARLVGRIEIAVEVNQRK